MIPRSPQQNPLYGLASMSEPPLVAIYVYRHSKPVEILQMEKRLPKLLVSLVGFAVAMLYKFQILYNMFWGCCCYQAKVFGSVSTANKN